MASERTRHGAIASAAALEHLIGCTPHAIALKLIDHLDTRHTIR